MPGSPDWSAFRAEALKTFSELGTDLRADIWNEENAAFLRIMAEDAAGLALKLASATDPAKRARYRRSLDLIANSVAVTAFSRLNVVENEVNARVFMLLDKTAKFALRALLAGVGLA